MTEDREWSVDLLAKAQDGDEDALNRLVERYLPRLQQWAHGRMPAGIRTMRDTGDLVQESLINALRNLKTLEWRSEGALQAYLRRSINNGIIDQYRRHERHPHRDELPEDVVARDASPLESAIGVETVAMYERALASLRDEDREAIILRVELGLSYDEIANQLEKPTANAARVAVTRALARLAKAMCAGTG
jgi:RNA polymerase sigma-70 factor (ECF subfamily)